jgi:signal peptidase I
MNSEEISSSKESENITTANEADPDTESAANGEDTGKVIARRLRREMFEWFQAIIFAVILALFIRTFIVQAFKIPSASMEPTLLVGDHIMVNKFIFGTKIPFTDISLLEWQQPERGDIIIFLMPRDLTQKQEMEQRAEEARASGDEIAYQRYKQKAAGIEVRDFVKRIMGEPGDTLEVRGNRVYIDGEAVDDPWGSYNNNYSGLRGNFGPVNVPEGHYFCMGDNRDNSEDSRVWGFVPIENIKGQAFVIYWSWADGRGLRWDRIMSIVE